MHTGKVEVSQQGDVYIWGGACRQVRWTLGQVVLCGLSMNDCIYNISNNYYDTQFSKELTQWTYLSILNCLLY